MTHSQADSLWERAFTSLKDEDKLFANPHDIDKRTFLRDIAHAVEEKQQRCSKKEWRISHDGSSVSIRDVLGKIVSWINKFKEIGDVAVQYDPAHAALPWAAVRLVLQAVINEHQTNEALLEGLEYTSSLITRFAMVEGLYLCQTSIASKQLSQAIVRLYSAVLAYLAKAGKFYSRNTGVRFLKTVTRPVELDVDTYLHRIRAEETKVNELARLLDADHIRQITAFMERQFTSYDNRLDSIDQGIQSLSLDFAKKISTQMISKDQVLNWIDAVFTKQNYEQALAARVEGSCNWVLNRPEFLGWIDAPTSDQFTNFLWIHGPAGFGKSILCARLVQHLRDDLSKPVSFFFCSFIGELRRQPRSILRSWIAQLIFQHDDACDIAKYAYLERQSSVATEHDLWHLFVKLSARISNCVFVVDGFDECATATPSLRSHEASSSRMDFLKSLIRFTEEKGTRVLLVSREDHYIRQQLATVGASSSTHQVFQLGITKQDTLDDVNAFSSVLMNKKLPNKTDGVREDLASTAAEKCDGMFLWIKLLQERLSPGKNARQLQKVVTDTPTGLNQAYERDLRAIDDLPPDERNRAYAILRWTLYAIRPLNVRELTEALLFESLDEDSSFPVDELPDAYDDFYVDDQLRRLCGSLLEIKAQDHSTDFSTHVVQFVHFSVKEYLCTTFDRPLSAHHGISLSNHAGNHGLLAQHCLRYLCCDDLVRSSLSTKEEFDQTTQKYAFLEYASDNWCDHTSRGGPPSADLIGLSNRLHDPSASRWRLYSEVYLNEVFVDFSECLSIYGESWPDPLYLASATDIVDTVQWVLSKGANVNAVGGPHATALQIAACRGSVEVFELLLSQGADPFITGGEHGSVVNAAAAPNPHSAEKSERMVSKLLSKGVDLEFPDEKGQRPLHCASASGALNVVQLLLKSGADINAATLQNRTALLIACEKAYAKIVSCLLSKGADWLIEFRDDDVESLAAGAAIHIAIVRNNEQIVRILLEHGVDCNLATSMGAKALHYAVWKGHHSITQMLLSHGAEVSATNSKGWTALHWAAELGFGSIAEVLLKYGADVDAGGGPDSLTACYLATRKGHVDIARLLLDSCASVEGLHSISEVSIPPQTSQMSKFRQKERRIAYLIQAGRDTDPKTLRGPNWPFLSAAVEHGSSETLQLVLNFGASIDVRYDDDRRTALFQAIHKKNLPVVLWLLDHGADANIPISSGWTCLDQATSTNQLEVTQALIKHGVFIDAPGQDERTSLLLATKCGNIEAVKVLLENGANANTPAAAGWTCLHVATSLDQIDMVQVLLDHGGNVNAQDHLGWTPLDMAVYEGYVEIVNILTTRSTGSDMSEVFGFTVLYEAADKNQVQTLRSLITKSTNVTLHGLPGWIALNLAARAGHCEILEVLINNGADPNSAQESGWTCLHAAARSGHVEVAKYLLKRGANPAGMTTDVDQSAAIHCAIYNDHKDVVRAFLEHGADKDVQNSCGRTPLHLACTKESQEIFDTILEAGCNVNVEDFLGRTPLIYSACHSPQAPAYLSTLLNAGARIYQTDFRGRSALHHSVIGILDNLREKKAAAKLADESWAAETLCETDQSILSILLSHGADPFQRDSRGWSSLDWASLNPDLLVSNSLAPFQHVPDEAQTKITRHQALKSAIDHLVFLTTLKPATSKELLVQCYGYVGRQLLASDHIQDARTALGHTMTYDNDGDIEHNAYCDICSLWIVGDRYLCESCAEVDLCGDCLKLYENESTHPTPENPLLGICQGHSFLLASVEKWQELPKGEVNEQGESLEQFVERLKRTHT